MTTVQNLAIRMGLDTTKLDQQMTKTKRKFGGFKKDVDKATRSMSGLQRAGRGAAQGIAAFDGPMGGVASRLNAVNGMLHSGSLAWVGLGAAVAGATAILYKSIRANEEAERQLFKTEALLKSTGFAAGKTTEQLDAQARALALNTLASTEGIREAQHVLLTFKSVQKDTFDEAIVLAQDMASVFGGTAKTAALQLGKALEDPTKGITALARSGVTFTEKQKDLIKQLTKTGKLYNAQSIILKQIQEQVAGAGSGEAQGLSGAVDTLKQRWQEFLQALEKTTGSGTAASEFLNTLSKGLQRLKEELDPTRQTLMANLVNEREALKEELARLAGGHGNTSFWEKVTGGASVAIRDTKDRLAEVNAEYKRLLNEWETETRAANDALIAADKAKDDKIREDRAAARKKEAAEAAEEAAEKAKKDAEEFKEGRVKALEDAKNFTMEVKLDKLSEFEQEIELEKLKTQNLKDELEARKQALKDYGVFNGENKKAIEAAEANIDAISAKKKQDIINNRNKKIEEERQATIDRVTALTATNSKKLTAIAKGTGIADATIKGAQAIQGAWASAPFPANIPAVALTTAETFANIQTIKGVAHGGMSNVPSESTYLLDKGERVLSPNQNKDFTDYLKSGGGGGMNVIVNNYGNDQVQARQEGNNIEIIIGQVKNAFTDEVNRGTGFAQTLQHTYGLTRRGFA